MTEDEYLDQLETEAYLRWVAAQEPGTDTSLDAYAEYTVALAEAWIDRESGKWGVRS